MIITPEKEKLHIKLETVVEDKIPHPDVTPEDFTVWMIRRELRRRRHDSDSRVVGTDSDSMVAYILTGEWKEPTYSLSTYELNSVINLYLLAPPSIQKVLEPIVERTKERAYSSKILAY